MFAPRDRPRLVVGETGLAAVVEVTGITVVSLPDGAALASIPSEPSAVATQVGWLGARLLVLHRYANETAAHLCDPRTVAVVAELWLGARLRLAATAGAHALVASPLGCAVVSARGDQLTAREWIDATVPDAAGSAGPGFVIAAGDRIEAWDPERRVAARRIGLRWPDEVAHVGGHDRAAWIVAHRSRSRLEVIPWLDGPIELHELPAPIAQVASHPHGELVACLDDGGGLHLVGGGPPRRVEVPGLERVEAVALVADGERARVLAAQGTRPLVLVDAGELRRTTESETTSARALARPTELSAGDPDPGWREAAAGWARAVAEGTLDRGAPAAPPIDALVAQLGLAGDVVPALVLLYGAHLGGTTGAALGDVAHVLGSWDEPLGGGQLVARGLATVSGSRMRLAPAIRARLDALP